MTVLPGLITCHLHPDFYKFEIGAGDRPGHGAAPGRDDGDRRPHLPRAAGERLHRLRRRLVRARHRRAAQDGDRPGHHPRPAHPGLRPPHRHHRRHEQPGAVVEGLRDARRRPRRRRTRRAAQAGARRDRPRRRDHQDLRQRRARRTQPHDAEHVARRDRHDRRHRPRARARRSGPTSPTGR